MGRYNFSSPWAAAGNAIEELMLRQKVEERQKMLDELTKKHTESQLSTEGLQRTALENEIALAKAGAKTTRAASLAKNLKPGDDPRARGASDEDMEALQSGLYLQPQPSKPSSEGPTAQELEMLQSSVTGDLEAESNPERRQALSTELETMRQTPTVEQPPPQLVYAGTPEHRTTQERLAKLSELEEMFADPNTDPAQKQLAYITAMGSGDISPELLRTLGARQAVQLSEDTGKVTPMSVDGKPVMSGTDIAVRSRRPRDYAAASQQLVVVDGKPMQYNPRTGTLSAPKVEGGAPITDVTRIGTGKTTGSRRPGPTIPQGTTTKLADLAAKYARSQSERDLLQWISLASLATSNANVSDPSVKDAAMAILFSVDDSGEFKYNYSTDTTDQLLDKMAADPNSPIDLSNATSQEVSDLKDILRSIRRR